MNIPTLRYLTTDSRSIFDPENTIFAALRTELSDGHNYIADVCRMGTGAIIADHIPAGCENFATQFIIVPDVARAMAHIAAKQLAGYNGGIVITGSVGKTTEKELLYNALTAAGIKVARSPRSWNSAIGLPLAVWDMTAGEASMLITEAGIDGPAQGTFLADILGNSVEIGVITPITSEHDEAFISHKDKIKEKIDIVANCSTIIYADTDPALGTMLRHRFANSDKALIAVEKGTHPTIYHALAAAVLREKGIAGIDVDSLPTAQKRREITGGTWGNTIIRDTFTPDITSLRLALDFAIRRATEAHATVLVLGNLMHSPALSPAEIARLYEAAINMARKFGVEKILTVAEEYAAIKGVQTDIDSLCAAYLHGTLLQNKEILLFGSGDNLRTFAQTSESVGHDTTLEVNLDALIANYNYYRSLVPAGTGIVAMVKASAYGLGSIELAKALQSRRAAYLAVAVIDEGIALREAGITMPVMVLNPVTNRYPALFASNLEPAVFSFDELERLIAEAGKAGVKNYPIHIKLDTGMHRVGFIASQIPQLIQELNATDAVRVRSVFSHLATADCPDMDHYTIGQLNTFTADTEELRKGLGYNFLRHILNTAGMMRFANATSYEMARLGIGLYGISPLPGKNPLHTVATFQSRIISLKHWPKDTPIGYGCKGHTSEDDSIIATIPVGYADGVNRRLGNGRTSFVIKGVECPTIGNICMDLCMVDVSRVPGVAVGDRVEIFGTAMPVERVADALGTIPYEILTSVSPRVKRVYTTMQ